MAVGNNLPLVGVKSLGVRTTFGSWLSPGSRVAAYLGPAGVFEDPYSENMRVSTLALAAGRVRSGKGDVILALPGYAENVNSAAYANLPAGTKLIGLGTPGESSAPKLTWTLAAATLLLSNADITIQNMTLDFAGVDNVAAPITVTGRGFQLLNCKVVLQSAALSAGCVKGVTLGAGAHGAVISGNKFLSDDTGEPQDGGGAIAVGAAASNALDDILIEDNYILSASPGDTVGQIDVITTCTNVRILRNMLVNLAADANTGIRVDDVVSNGIVAYNLVKLAEAQTLAGAGVIVSGTTNPTWGVFENRVLDDLESVSGALTPGVGT
jgi:hypothetical protein